jgi:hypothetical protein
MTTSLEALGKNAFALKGNLDFQSVVTLWEYFVSSRHCTSTLPV